jgi:hypothetical protein
LAAATARFDKLVRDPDRTPANCPEGLLLEPDRVRNREVLQLREHVNRVDKKGLVRTIDQIECLLNIATHRHGELLDAVAPDVWEFPKDECDTESDELLEAFPGFKRAFERHHGEGAAGTPEPSGSAQLGRGSAASGSQGHSSDVAAVPKGKRGRHFQRRMAQFTQVLRDQRARNTGN